MNETTKIIIMKKSDIPEAVYATIKELGFKVRQQQNGNISFWKSSKHPMSIVFLDEEKSSFRIKLWIGNLADELQMKAAKACCIRLNPTLYLTKFAVEKERGSYGMCTVIDHMCYTQSEVRKFMPLATELIVMDSIKAINFMNEKVKQLKKAE